MSYFNLSDALKVSTSEYLDFTTKSKEELLNKLQIQAQKDLEQQFLDNIKETSIAKKSEINFLGKNAANLITTEKDELIKNELRYIFNILIQEFLEIFDEKTLSWFIKNAFFAGGAIRSLLTGSPINDYDIYFYSYLINSLKPIMLESFNKSKNIKVLSITDNAITFSINDFDGKSKTIQFITRYSGTPEDVLNTFDYSNCLASYYPYQDMLFISDQMIESIKTKQLKFNPKCWNPLQSMKRLLKFSKQGYDVSDKILAEILEACMKCSKADLSILTLSKCAYTGKKND